MSEVKKFNKEIQMNATEVLNGHYNNILEIKKKAQKVQRASHMPPPLEILPSLRRTRAEEDDQVRERKELYG